MKPTESPLFPKLIVRILADYYSVPYRFDVVYLFCQSSDNQDSVIRKGARLFPGFTGNIAISGLYKRPGHSGKDCWLQKLDKLGVPKQSVFILPFSESSNTLTEAQYLMEFADRQGYKRIGVVSPAFHLVRSFITAVSVVITSERNLAVYAIPGEPLPWDESVVHSQGILTGKRFELLDAEFDRIDRYTEKGDLLGPENVWSYLKRRDENNP